MANCENCKRTGVEITTFEWSEKCTVQACKWCLRRLEFDREAKNFLIHALKENAAGRLDNSIEQLDRTLDRPLSAHMRRDVLCVRAEFLAQRGAFAEAIETCRLIDRIHVDAPPVGRAYSRMMNKLVLCELLRTTGDLETACQEIRAAIKLGVPHKTLHDTLLLALTELCAVQKARNHVRPPPPFVQRALETAASTFGLASGEIRDWASFGAVVQLARKAVTLNLPRREMAADTPIE